MKWIIVLAFACCAAAGCSRSNKELNLQLAGSDSVAVNFFTGDGRMDTVTAVKIIRDVQKVQQLAAFISADVRDADMRCGYDGSLHFFKNNVVLQDVDFRMNDAGCMQFWLKYQGKQLQAKLSGDAKLLLEAIQKN
jgi:hypothetical protein